MMCIKNNRSLDIVPREHTSYALGKTVLTIEDSAIVSECVSGSIWHTARQLGHFFLFFRSCKPSCYEVQQLGVAALETFCEQRLYEKRRAI